MLCNLDDVPVAKHLSLALQVSAECTFRQTDDACKPSLSYITVFYQILDALTRITGKISLRHSIVTSAAHSKLF